MRQFFPAVIVFCLIVTLTQAQTKTEFGITTEGSLFFPMNSSGYSLPKGNSIGLGAGIYASRDLFGKFSADLGLGYRFKPMKEFVNMNQDGSGYPGGYGGYGYSPYGYSYSPYGYGYNYSYSTGGWEKFPLHYIVAPFHLRYNAWRNFFVQGGIEASWLLSYDAGNDKTEYNWSLGVGCRKYKLKWSLNYIGGFKEAGFANELYTIDGLRSATIYKNNMLQLNFSYPLWLKK